VTERKTIKNMCEGFMEVGSQGISKNVSHGYTLCLPAEFGVKAEVS
jgi:hypothetical protein